MSGRGGSLQGLSSAVRLTKGGYRLGRTAVVKQKRSQCGASRTPKGKLSVGPPAGQDRRYVGGHSGRSCAKGSSVLILVRGSGRGRSFPRDASTSKRAFRGLVGGRVDRGGGGPGANRPSGLRNELGGRGSHTRRGLGAHTTTATKERPGQRRATAS